MRQRAHRPGGRVSFWLLVQSKDEKAGTRRLTLLPTTELLDLLLLVQSLGVERDADADTSVILHTAARFLVRMLRILTAVRPSLNDKTTVTGRDKTLKDVGKLPRYLLERPLDLLILDLVQMRNQLFDRFLRSVELLSSLQELVLLRSEAVILFKSLLVDVLVLPECLVDLLEPGVDLNL